MFSEGRQGALLLFCNRYLHTIVIKQYRNALFLVFAVCTVQSVIAEVYEEPDAFLSKVFNGDTPDASTLWLKSEQKERIRDLLGRDLAALRVRYWGRDQRTAWILEEIGKEQPITVGIVVNNNRIETVKVLVFRESRGWEVKYPFFTNQFKQVELDSHLELSKPIDGITGATLSVRALRKLGRLALYYHQQVTASP